MKKVVCLLLAACFVLAAVGCGQRAAQPDEKTSSSSSQALALKIGLLLPADANDPLSYAHLQGLRDAISALDLPQETLQVAYGVKAGEEARSAAEQMVQQGCDILFGAEFGYEDDLLEAAFAHEQIQFCAAGGYQAALFGPQNLHDYSVAEFEGRFLAGMVAGAKINEELEAGTITPDQALLGYVGSLSYAECRSAFTAFYLGARRVCPTVTMRVRYTGSWADRKEEEKAARKLIKEGCVVIAHQSATVAVAQTCEEAGVWVVGFGVPLSQYAPTKGLANVQADWSAYYRQALEQMLQKSPLPTDCCVGLKDGAIHLDNFAPQAFRSFDAVQKAVEEAELAIQKHTVGVFDVTAFTVGGAMLTTTTDEANREEYLGRELIRNGVFAEGEIVSAPLFNFVIDGIEESNQFY